tara:strand:+ start:5963 stop:6208 length:246 start_codon:yes stop_codon:yes gene_type:complete
MNIRDFRLFGFALIDVIATLIIALILHYYMWTKPTHKDLNNRTFLQYFLSMFLIIITFFGLGFILHWFFSIDSKLSLYLGI